MIFILKSYNVIQRLTFMYQKKKKISSLKKFYFSSIIIGFGLVFLYLIDPTCPILSISMSIGASVLTAGIMAIIVDVRSNKQKKFLKTSFLKDTLSITDYTIKELEGVYKEINEDNDTIFAFKDFSDFIKRSNLFIFQTAELDIDKNKEACEKMRSAIDDIISTSFIVKSCELAISNYRHILEFQYDLIFESVLSQEQIDIIQMAKGKMEAFIREYNERKYTVIISNRLNFIDELRQIRDFCSK